MIGCMLPLLMLWSGLGAFDPDTAPTVRWMAFAVFMVCLLALLWAWLTGRIDD